MKKLLKKTLSIFVTLLILATSVLTAFSATDPYQSHVDYSSKISGTITVKSNADHYTYGGYVGLYGHPWTYHYYINGRTAFCAWGSNNQVTPVTATRDKYLLSPSSKRAKATYWLCWASNNPNHANAPNDSKTTGYYSTISSSFKTALANLKSTSGYNYTGNTYEAVIKSVLTDLKNKSDGASLPNSSSSDPTSAAYQFCLGHSLIDYLQQGTHHGGLDDTWRNAVENLAKLCDSLPNVPSAYRVYYTYPAGNASQQSLMTVELANGNAQVKKTSSNPTLTNNNPCYSLAGAEYSFYTKSNCPASSYVGKVTTTASGTSNTLSLPAGTYYCKETKAPTGFAISTQIEQVTITAGKTTTINVSDKPQSDPPLIVLNKIDSETGEVVSGAVYELRYYRGYYDTVEALNGVDYERHWFLISDADGAAYLREEYLYGDDNDEFFITSDTPYPVLPLGTMTIKEVIAPDGYYLDQNTYLRKVIGSGDDLYVDTYNEPTSEEKPIPKLSITGTKEWLDAENRDGIRPENVTVNLYRDDSDEPIDTQIVSSDTDWKFEFSNLPEGCNDSSAENGKHIYKYTIGEVEVEGYDTTITELIQVDDTTEYTCDITNTHEPERININGKKTWNDYNNVMFYRPNEITVSLYDRDDMETVVDSTVVSSDDDWEYNFSELYKYKNNGQLINYVVKENTVENYNSVVTGYDITNNIKTGTITLKKQNGTLQGLPYVEFKLKATTAKGTTKLIRATEISEGVYQFTTGTVGNVAFFETNSEGKITITGLPVGEYWFNEYITCEGYIPYEDDIKFTITENSDETITVVNNKILMYNTGGQGNTVIYIIAGCIALLSALLFAIYLIIKNQKKGKESMKKIMSILIAVMLVGAMMFSAIPGFSAESTLNTSTPTSFSFNCDKQGYEFSIYKVGSIKKITTDPYEVKYESTIPSLATSIVNGDSPALLSALDELSVAELGAVVGTYNTSVDGATKAFTNQEQGIYYVRATNFPAGVREVTNSVFALPYYTSTEVWEYSLENIALATKVVDDVPEIVKTITNSTKDNKEYTDVSLGDTVEYKVKASKAGSYSNTASKDFRLNSYVVKDVMSKGLTLNQDSFAVKLVDSDENTISTLTRDTDYVVNVTATEGQDTEFTVSLSSTFLKGTALYGSNVSDVVITYSAVLNKYATTAFVGNPNEAVSLTYSNKNDVTAEIDGNTVYTYTYGVLVNKFDESNNALAGAKFALYTTQNDAKNNTNALATGTSDNTGKVRFKNNKGEEIRLQSGTYYIVETEAPAGYNRYTDVITVDITAEYSDTFTEGTWISSAPENGIAVVTVKDSKVVLPQTGGNGTFLIYLIAGIGLAVASVTFVISKKKTSKTKA